MKLTLKSFFILLLFGAFALPFIFQINIFPFVQYGMYAHKPTKTEYFSLLKDGKTIQKEEFPLPYSMLNYLLRKESYSNNLKTTLEELHQLPDLKNSKTLSVLKIEQDTSLAFSKDFE